MGSKMKISIGDKFYSDKAKCIITVVDVGEIYALIQSDRSIKYNYQPNVKRLTSFKECDRVTWKLQDSERISKAA